LLLLKETYPRPSRETLIFLILSEILVTNNCHSIGSLIVPTNKSLTMRTKKRRRTTKCRRTSLSNNLRVKPRRLISSRLRSIFTKRKEVTSTLKLQPIVELLILTMCEHFQ